MEKVVLNKVIDWLKGEVSLGMDLKLTETFKEIHNDGAIDGRIECAEGLLEMIDKWKDEEKNKPPKTMTMADLNKDMRENPEKYHSKELMDELKKLGLPIRRDK